MQYWREFSPSIYLTCERKREGMRPNYIWYRTSHCCHQKSEECRRMCSKTWRMDMKFCGILSLIRTHSLLLSLSFCLTPLHLFFPIFKEWTSVLHATELHPTLNMWCYLVQCTSGRSIMYSVDCGLMHGLTNSRTLACYRTQMFKWASSDFEHVMLLGLLH